MYLYYAAFFNNGKSFYKIGVTGCLIKRLRHLHHCGMKCKLLYVEKFESSDDAFKAELKIKTEFREHIVKSNKGKELYTEIFKRDVLGKGDVQADSFVEAVNTVLFGSFVKKKKADKTAHHPFSGVDITHCWNE